jgi:hypothetical protein
MRAYRSWVLAGTVLGLAQAALAVDVPFAGTLSPNDPVYNRTLSGNPPGGLSAVGTAVTYDLYPFYVSANGTYLAETLSARFAPGTADDTFITIYQGSFNAGAPLANAIIADDDSGVGGLSLATKALTSGTQYYLVVTSFANGQLGDYTGHLNSTNNLGQVILGAVPELPTSTLMLSAMAVVALAARRRRTT